MSENTMSSAVMNKASIAVNRFGYGAKDNELELAKSSPKSWIKSKLLPISFKTNLAHSNDIFTDHAAYLKLKQQLKKNKSLENQTNMMTKNYARMALKEMSVDTLQEAIDSSHSVSWRLLDFFSNHFSVSTNGRLMTGLAGTLEREAIAPNLLGNFEDMLLAVEQHPAMLIYLNNEKSFGPNSRMALKSKKSKKSKKGLNENLAREILELHTLGVDGGYKQQDVLELAKGITGWSVKNPNKENSAGFIFLSNGHEPGSRKLLGKRYPPKGITQGRQMLRDLAMQPATAKYLCYKLAHHFVSDNPSPVLLAKMEDTWMKNQGNITKVMHTLFDAEEAWIDGPQKYKTPREFVISAQRALALKKRNNKALLNSLINLGQEPYNAGSPAGFSDDEKDWLGASALMARIDWSMMVSGYLKRANAEKIMKLALGESVSNLTYQMVMRAESRQQALSLLLMSPEFQRR